MSETKRAVTKAYVVAERGGPFELREVVLDGLQPNEVLVEIKYTGLCHTVRYLDKTAKLKTNVRL